MNQTLSLDTLDPLHNVPLSSKRWSCCCRAAERLPRRHGTTTPVYGWPEQRVPSASIHSCSTQEQPPSLHICIWQKNELLQPLQALVDAMHAALSPPPTKKTKQKNTAWHYCASWWWPDWSCNQCWALFQQSHTIALILFPMHVCRKRIWWPLWC